jgi:hypothetical protein
MRAFIIKEASKQNVNATYGKLVLKLKFEIIFDVMKMFVIL